MGEAKRAMLVFVLLAVAVHPGWAEAVVLNAGDIIVTDGDANDGRVVRVHPITGAQTVISTGGMLGRPRGVAIDGAGQIVVATNGAVIRVDPATGLQTSISTGGLLLSPTGVVIDTTGQIFVTDADTHGVIRIDPGTGSQTLISSGGSLFWSHALAFDHGGQLMVGDSSWSLDGSIVRVNPATGVQTVVSLNGMLQSPTGVDVDDAGRIVAIEQSTDELMQIDPTTGAQTLISSGNHLTLATGVAVDGAGQLIVADQDAGIVRVDPVTSVQTVVSSFHGPWGVVVALADLVQTAVSNPPATILLGDDFSVTETLRNQGTVTAGPSTTLFFLSLDRVPSGGDIWLEGGIRSVGALARGASSTATLSVTVGDATPLGSYYVLACADWLDAVPERWSWNNCRASNTRVQVTAPDLASVKVKSPPATAVVGGTFTAGDTVTNRGAAAAWATSTRYYLSLNQTKDSTDRALTARAVPALAPGASNAGQATVTVPSVAPGMYYVLACADDTDRIAESDEMNNCLASNGRVAITGPDLVVTSVSNPPATSGLGWSFAVTDTVQNQGGAGAGDSVTRYYLSLDTVRNGGDVLLSGQRAVGSLAPAGTSTGNATVIIPLNAPGGTFYLLACADDTSLVVETVEGNNCRASATRVNIPVYQ